MTAWRPAAGHLVRGVLLRSLLLFGLVLAGCANGTVAGTPEPAGSRPSGVDPPNVSTCEVNPVPLGPGESVPTPAGAPLVTITQGTNAWVASERTQPFAIAVYADGTAIRAEDAGTAADPPARLTIGRIHPCALAADSAEIIALAAGDLGDPQVTDQGTTTVTMHQPAGDVVVAAYALGAGDASLSASQQAARRRLSTLIDDMKTALTDTRSWTPDRLRLTTYGPPTDTAGAARWPLATGIDQTLGRDRSSCAVIAGDDATTLLDALGRRPAASGWTDGQRTAVLAIGPLVPGQQGCPS